MLLFAKLFITVQTVWILVRIIEWPELSDTFNYFCCLFFVFKHWYFTPVSWKIVFKFSLLIWIFTSCFHCDSFTDFTINTINLLSFELLVSLRVCIQAPSLLLFRINPIMLDGVLFIYLDFIAHGETNIEAEPSKLLLWAGVELSFGVPEISSVLQRAHNSSQNIGSLVLVLGLESLTFGCWRCFLSDSSIGLMKSSWLHRPWTLGRQDVLCCHLMSPLHCVPPPLAVDSLWWWTKTVSVPFSGVLSLSPAFSHLFLSVHSFSCTSLYPVICCWCLIKAFKLQVIQTFNFILSVLWTKWAERSGALWCASWLWSSAEHS